MWALPPTENTSCGSINSLKRDLLNSVHLVDVLTCLAMNYLLQFEQTGLAVNTNTVSFRHPRNNSNELYWGEILTLANGITGLRNDLRRRGG